MGGIGVLMRRRRSLTVATMTSVRLASVLAAALAFAPLSAPAVQITDLDRAVDPCTDFDAFANGAWRVANPIPSGTDRWSRRFAARAANRQQLIALLEELALKKDFPRGSIEQQLGDHFAACMDEAGSDAKSLAPLQPLLAEIAAVRDVAGVARAIRRLHELAVPVPFVLTGASNYHDPASVIVNIAAGGQGLPDGAHLRRVLTLGGMAESAAQKAATEILALETRLAEASLPPAAAADPATTAHPYSFAQLQQLAPRFDWQSYFAEADLPRAELNIAEPAFLERLNRELGATPVEVWKTYLTLHLLEWFSFPDGAPKPRPVRCLESTEALLGEPLGRKYAERFFPPAAKAKVREMVSSLLAVLKDEVAGLPWMAAATRQQALAKIASYDVKVGYPDAWADTSGLIIRRDAFWSNVAAARRFGVDANRRRVGQRVGRDLWQLPPSSSAAYIDVQLNQIVLPAGFLQPPAFDLGATDAANYGAIGIGVAHDLTHAIDLLGADFDATGQPRNWWVNADRQAFQKLGQCVVDQYEGYFVEPGVHHRGKQVLGEAIGDLAGVRIAYLALERALRQRPNPTLDGFTPEQQFFLSWAQYRGAAESPDLQRQLVKTDSHATSKYRVIGPLSSSPEFQRAFACPAGSAMVQPAAQRCRVW
jgi:endothelin-converting enzyme/putative endopeptidase